MTANHEEIQAFLRDHPVPSPEAPSTRKAGIIPFLPNPLRYQVMVPVASKPDLGLPDFQLCKGTRMMKKDGRWVDMRGDVPDDVRREPLAHTALREGIEELGIILDNIKRSFPLGEFRFISATSRTEVTLWLMAAEMKDEHEMLSDAHVAKYTTARAWQSLQEFARLGRVDHAHILGLVEEKIRAHQ